jgi:predicted DCC family thiol-disulfide oxidoreductase YuxK
MVASTKKVPLRPKISVQESFSYRSDPAVPLFPDDRPIFIFDGACVFCCGFANFILRKDRLRRFRLMTVQTPLGTALYRHFGLDPTAAETNVLLEDGRAFFKSEGSLRVFRRLGFPYSLIAMGRLLPRSARDRAYDVIARNRFRWFGTWDACRVPDPSERDRFLS